MINKIPTKIISKLWKNKKLRLKKLLTKGYSVWVIYLDIENFDELELNFGTQICNSILKKLKLEIKRSLKQQHYSFRMGFFESREGDDFVVYFIPNENSPWSINGLIDKWVKPLEESLNKGTNLVEKVKLRAGIVLCNNEAGRSTESLLNNAVKEAFILNKAIHDARYFEKKNEVDILVKEPNNLLRIAYQPILNINSGKIFGFEALARMNTTSVFKNILEMFSFVEKIGQLYPVETVCRRQAIYSAPKILEEQETLFLNISPKVLHDPGFEAGQTKKVLNDYGLDSSNVVLEITERNAIEDFNLFRQALAHYRNQGFRIALDDVGAGYSSLQAIAEIHPDFLKIDRSLISGVNENPVKWALIETFVTFARRIGCQIIAEGVETEEEMCTVIQLGVDYVQGYFIGKPNFERINISENIWNILKIKKQKRHNDDFAISTIMEPLTAFESKIAIKVVEEYFRKHGNQLVVGVTENGKIIGIIQRENMFSMLATRYGVALYSDRDISFIMDRSPLIVEVTTPIEVVSSLAMGRPNPRLYDGIIIVNKQKHVGMVTVSSLMKAMAERQIQIAQGANPLTGLPGNLWINEEIRLNLDKQESFNVIYADLNNFKEYNDLYGFEQGDIAIKVFAGVLQKEITKIEFDAFIGHIGGDDFIVLSKSRDLESCCKVIINSFIQERKTLLGSEKLSVSLAGLVVNTNKNLSPIKLAEYAALLKKKVKDLKGDNFLVEECLLV